MANTPGATPAYRKPPVIEVSAGIQFPRLLKWQTSHFGDLWDSKFRSEYPRVTDAPPVENAYEGPPRIEFSLSQLPPLRRVMLRSMDDCYLVQVQDSRFHLNWRKAAESQQYPRFPEVYRRFKSAWEMFGEYVASNNLGQVSAERFELTYVNNIAVDSSIGFAHSLENFVRLFNWSEVNPQYLAPPRSASSVLQFEMPGGAGAMNANLTHVRGPQNRDIMVLALNCAGKPRPGHTPDQWFEEAHQMIVRGFTDLTTPTAHKLWERTS